jgi:hypothetical protein
MGVANYIYEATQQFLGDIQMLRVFLHRADQATEVVFEVFLGGKHVARLTTSPREINLPLSEPQLYGLFGDPSKQPAFIIPDYISSGLDYVLSKKGDSSAPIWLSLGSPFGFLPIVPWQALLQPLFRSPVLRLPYLSVKPFMPSESLDVIICIAAKTGSLDSIADQLGPKLAGLRRRLVRLYIFSSGMMGELDKITQRFKSPSLSICCYHPESGPEYKPALDRTVRGLENPWLIWMKSAMGEKSGDVAYFIVDGSLSDQQASLRFAPSPLKGVDPNWGRYVSAQELSVFLNQVGCWSVGFRAPEDPWGSAALRLFQENLAQVRPGPIFLYDAAADANFAEFAAACGFLYGLKNSPLPVSRTISLFCHPSGTERSFVANVLAYLPFSLANKPRLRETLSKALSWNPKLKQGLDILVNNDAVRELLGSFTLASRTVTILQSKENTPVWLAAAQRVLEQALSRVIAAGLGSLESEKVEIPGGATVSVEGVVRVPEKVTAMPASTWQAKMAKHSFNGEEAREGAQEALAIVADIVAAEAQETSSKKDS